MMKEAEHLHLPVHALRRDQVLKNVRHLLQSDTLVVSRIGDRPDDAERPVADRPVGRRLHIRRQSAATDTVAAVRRAAEVRMGRFDDCIVVAGRAGAGQTVVAEAAGQLLAYQLVA